MTISPFVQLFGTNVVPSPSLALHIREIISTREADLIHIDREISRLGGVQKGLSKLREQAKNDIWAYKALLSPVRRIPPEIWSKMFELCLPEASQLVRVNTMEPPLLFCHVCSFWRQISISTPQLWCRISMKGSKNVLNSRIPLVQMWLSRSGDLPLSIEITCSRDRRELCPDKFVQGILPYSRRWQHLNLDLSLSAAKMLLSNPKAPLPLLESVKLDVQTAMTDHDSFAISSSARRLRTVSVHTTRFNPSAFLLPWAQLTSLFLSAMSIAPSVRECLELLRQCPKLQFARIPVDDASPSFDTSCLPPVVIPGLHTLYINTCGDFSPFINRLVLPSLRKFLVNKWTSPNISSFLSLISRSSCRLQKLICQEAPLSEHDLAAIVYNIPTLVELVATRYDRANCRRDNLVTPLIAASLERKRRALPGEPIRCGMQLGGTQLQ